ncbi:hypothetical protein [Methylobacterium durans]|uniref:hypothetical protein n=1 Tax=Methylobacterium durans TaxID=2202825 RepID=UPI0018804DB8|nr:hypothetical protein [Methylobacterium durans]
MLLNQTSLVRRGLLALTSTCLVLGTAAHVQAADEGGLGGLFQQLFSPQPAQAPQPAPAAQPPANGGAYGSDASAGYGYGRREWRQSARRRQLKDAQAQVRPKVRYAALPRPEKVKAVAEKPKASEAQAALWRYAGNPNAALMHDSTLRKGDIVITTNGPKVFTGKTEARHAAGDFEPVSRSSAVDRKTRTLLAAMVAPHGAVPADEARKAMAKLSRSSEPATAPAATQAQASGMRVVYPSADQPAAVKVSLQEQ